MVAPTPEDAAEAAAADAAAADATAVDAAAPDAAATNSAAADAEKQKASNEGERRESQVDKRETRDDFDNDDDDDDDEYDDEGEVSSPGVETEEEDEARVGNDEDEKVTSGVTSGDAVSPSGVSSLAGLVSPNAGPMSQLSGRSWLLGRRLPLAGTTPGGVGGQQTTPLQ